MENEGIEIDPESKMSHAEIIEMMGEANEQIDELETTEKKLNRVEAGGKTKKI